jgi:hypothetical protein
MKSIIEPTGAVYCTLRGAVTDGDVPHQNQTYATITSDNLMYDEHGKVDNGKRYLIHERVISR